MNLFYFSSLAVKFTRFIFFLTVMGLYFISPARTADYNDFFSNSSNTAYEKILVTRIISNDTFELEDGQKIRLIGIKAIEPPKRRKEDTQYDKYGFVIEDTGNPVISLEEKGYTYVTELVLDKHVRLEFDTDKRDDQHYAYAYVFLPDNNIFVNAEILKQGFASLQISPPNTKYAAVLREAYKEGRKEKRGIHGDY